MTTNASWQTVILNGVSGQEKDPTVRGWLSRSQDRNADGIVLGAPMGSTVGIGGVDEPARSTDVFYGLALFLDPSSPLILTREDSGMRFAEPSYDPTIAICGCKTSVIVADIRGEVNALRSCRQTHITLISRISSLLHNIAFILLPDKRKNIK